jgi:hypothetical protein
VEEDVAGAITAERGVERTCEGLDLGVAVEQPLGDVRTLEDVRVCDHVSV